MLPTTAIASAIAKKRSQIAENQPTFFVRVSKTKEDVIKLGDSLTEHRGSPGHEIILERVRRLEKIHDPK